MMTKCLGETLKAVRRVYCDWEDPNPQIDDTITIVLATLDPVQWLLVFLYPIVQFSLRMVFTETCSGSEPGNTTKCCNGAMEPEPIAMMSLFGLVLLILIVTQWRAHVIVGKCASIVKVVGNLAYFGSWLNYGMEVFFTACPVKHQRTLFIILLGVGFVLLTCPSLITGLRFRRITAIKEDD